MTADRRSDRSGPHPSRRFHGDLSDGPVFTGRTIVIATGAQYCKRQIPDVDRFNGTVVFSAATAVEAQRCSQAPVLIVGGGNSAWQAALGRPAAQCQFRGFARMAGCAAWMITGFYGWLRSVVG